MSRRIYPLNGLRAFESSARHMSFVKAAEELFVTPAAVSHQIKRLEDYLGMPLFKRRPRGLELAESGQLLAAELRDVFLRLDKAMERVVNSDSRGILTISVAPTFGAMWLIPRLQKFYAAYTDIDLRISTSLGLVDFQRDNFDAAIRLGDGDWFGLETIKLFDESVTPMCSPALLKGSNALSSPADLKNHLLLHNRSMDYDPSAPTWRTWLEAAGATGVDPEHGPQFSLPDHGLQASMDGSGVVLGWQYLSAHHVAAGRVVAPFDLSLPLGSSFYLVYPEAHSHRSSIVALREWLLEEIDEGNDPALAIT